MQPYQFAVLNFGLAALGLLHWINWHSDGESHLLQWTKLEARLAHDGKQPDLLAVAREHRLRYQQQPLPPFYATYALIYTLLMMLRLVSRVQFDTTTFVNDLSGGALYAAAASGLFTLLLGWLLVPGTVAWFVFCLVAALALTAPLEAFNVRVRAREAAVQQQ